MIQKVCFVCKEPISNKVKSATCKKLDCQYHHSVETDTWKKIQMDYLYGVTYETRGEEE